MNDDDLRSIVDASGFAFQLAVEELVSEANGQFSVSATEHAWVHPRTDRTGFADIVLDSGRVRMVVECKRVRDGQWVFLRADDRLVNGTIKTYAADLLWTGVKGQQATSATDRFMCVPESPQCPFCVVRGGGEGERSMLERIAGTLLEATEAIAHEQETLELTLRKAKPDTFFESIWFYVPVIVTNADLQVCSFDAKAVDLAKGVLPEKPTFDAAKVVRFRKNLSPDMTVGAHTDLTAVNRAKNRTVFVVAAPAFLEFLTHFSQVGELPRRLRRFVEST